MSNMSILSVGSCQRDITPKLPAALVGQYYRRVATEVYSPLTANILAISSGEDQAVLVSCDLLGIPRRLMPEVRRKAKALVPELDPMKIIVNAIHTHTGPFVYPDHASNFWGADFDYIPQLPDEQDPDAYADILSTIIAEGIREAWGNMEPVKLATGFDYLSIAYNRRTVYQDGHAEMYGSTARPDFKQMEGTTDSGIHFLSFTNGEGKLTAAVIELPCPSQILEHKSYIASDFWHDVRNHIHERYGDQVTVIALCGAAGDLSPRDLVRTAMEEPDMHATKMYNPEGVTYVAGRIARAFADFFDGPRNETDRAELRHVARDLPLPLRATTPEAVEQAKRDYDALRAKRVSMSDFTEPECMWLSIYAGVIKRYELQQESMTYPIEVHVLRIGDAVLATNPFELYVYYGDKIRSKTGNPNTFVVQLACGYEGYLPTQQAVENGGYSSYICNGAIGPEGGERLVEETLAMLGELK